MQQVAEILGTTKRVICLRMIDYSIPRRKPEGPNHGSWKGGRVNKMGYTSIWMPKHHRADHNGYVKEHILVMENEFGRKLKKSEHVHHIDFDRKNNSPKNLWVCTNKTHHIAEWTFMKLAKRLIESGVVFFDKRRGVYDFVKRGD